MGMPIRHYYTAADLLAMPEDGNKYEVVHGELLVSPSPRMLHQRIVTRLVSLLADYLSTQGVGEVYPGGALPFADDSFVTPDLLVHDLESARTQSWDLTSLPLLVIEVLSPSNARQDRFTKRRLYQEVGVPLYWVVDADAKCVEVWTPEALFPVTEHHEVCWRPDGADGPLVVGLGELFKTV